MRVFTVSGSFRNTERFLTKASKIDIPAILHQHGQNGTRALAMATPVSSGIAANTWYYVVKSYEDAHCLYWMNYDTERNVSVIIALQYGHATRSGGYVQGRDFINPAIRPIFDRIANDVWRAVTS